MFSGGLPRQWEIMIAVNHRLALSNPALSMSTSGVDGLALGLIANTSAAPSSS
jgi:hypothetical protein